MAKDFSKLIQNKEEFALDVSAWTNYIDRQSDIIANVIAGAPSLKNITPMVGAKANTTVEFPVLTVDVVWQSGDCIASGTGATTILKPRTATVKRFTDREELCLDKLDAVLPMIQSAGARNEELPFGQLYMDLKVQKNANQLEKAAWRSNLTGQTGNLAITNGWLAIADSEIADLGYYSTFTGMTAANALTFVQELLDNRTDIMFEMDNLIINTSLTNASYIAQAIRNLGNGAIFAGTGAYENNGQLNQAGFVEFYIPGENVRVRGTHGLNSNNSLFMTSEDNLKYITDLEHDKENVELFYDKSHKALVSDIVFSMTFQYAFPENVSYIKKV